LLVLACSSSSIVGVNLVSLGQDWCKHENCFVEMINRGDSFHDCWANIGTLIHMKDSIQSAIAPSATGSSHIRAASRRVEAMGASVGNPVQPPTVFELEEALAERVQTRELLGRNWRNRVYRVNSRPAMLRWRNR
jgi:hypothetical protein